MKTTAISTVRTEDPANRDAEWRLPSDTTVFDEIVADLASTLFSSFRRKDQRRKAEQYLQGLLTAPGRKSIRNIAAQVGGSSAEQGLHHFISSSTWDWRPLRAALASHLEQIHCSQAWVVRSTHIPKAGEHSVGVDKLFAPQSGKTFRGQRAFGVWSVSERLSAPINWRLFLPHQWVNDHERRDRAEVPEEFGTESLEECAVAAALDTVRLRGGRRRPVLVDLRQGGVAKAMARFASAGLPVLARVDASYPLAVGDRALPGYGAGALPARRILEMVKGMRRPVHWLDAETSWTSRTSLAAAVAVTCPAGPGAGHPRQLLLVGEWLDPARPPAQVWLTDMTQLQVAPLLRLTKLTRRVDRDFSHVGEATGLRDFVGRSFRGWHRHITLASAAHTAVVLARDDYGMARGVVPVSA
ncbi:transposase [Streptomyces xanthochromogenes]|uniref:IS701 family transposase n=1 Tax=Streptomyces xanthochromogenes TaxID=67384 RepID=UPI002F40ABF8